MKKIAKITTIGVVSAICGISVANGQLNEDLNTVNQPVEINNTDNTILEENQENIPQEGTENNVENTENVENKNETENTGNQEGNTENTENNTETEKQNEEENTEDIQNQGENNLENIENTENNEETVKQNISEKTEIKFFEENEKTVIFRENVYLDLNEEEKEIVNNKIKEKNPDLLENTKITIGEKIIFEFEDGSSKETDLENFVLIFDYNIQPVTIFKNKKIAQRMKDEITYNIIQSNPKAKVLSVDENGNAMIQMGNITQKIDASDLVLEINLPIEVIVQDKKNLTPEEKKKVLTEVINANKNIIIDFDFINDKYIEEDLRYTQIRMNVNKNSKNFALNNINNIYSIHFSQDRESDTKKYVLDKPVNNVANYNEIVILLDTEHINGWENKKFESYADNVVTADFLKDFLVDEEDLRNRLSEESLLSIIDNKAEEKNITENQNENIENKEKNIEEENIFTENKNENIESKEKNTEEENIFTENNLINRGSAGTSISIIKSNIVNTSVINNEPEEKNITENKNENIENKEKNTEEENISEKPEIKIFEENKTIEIIEDFSKKEIEETKEIIKIEENIFTENDKNSVNQILEIKKSDSINSEELSLPKRLPKTGTPEAILALISMFMSAIILRIKNFFN